MTKNKVLNIGLWAAQILLAGMFLMAGAMKTFQPIDEIAKMLPWVSDASPALIRFIGISELLGGLGLILPAALRIQSKLTNYAALGLALIMMLAAVFHFSRGEMAGVGNNLFLLALAIFVYWGRTKKALITPKA